MAAIPATSGVPTGDLINSPIPDTSGYESADVLAMNAYNNALAQINQQRLATLQQFGYKGTIDPATGTITGLGVDPNNPYGNLQQLLGTSADQSMQDAASNLARGLHGGLANQAVTADKNVFGGQSSQLGTDLENQLEGFQNDQSNAAYTRDNALWQAEQTAAENAVSQGQFDQPSYTGTSVPEYGSPGQNPQTVVPPSGKPHTNLNPPTKTSGARDKLIQSLLARHVAPSAWARNHPRQARAYGISTKHGGNVGLIKHLRKGR